MSAATCLDPKVFESIAAEFTASAASRIARNALTSGDLLDAIQDRDVKNSLNYVFSHKLAKESKVSSQKSSGRCWMFAAFNVMRLPLMKRLNLPSDFEISQSYLFFFDKIER
jgi:bleomycin hydrolase